LINSDSSVLFEASLTEDVLPDDPASSIGPPAVRDSIVLCRYSGSLRGLKVRAAQEAGAAGVILYNDPQEDGLFKSENGFSVFPEGPARHPSVIQRGGVSSLSVGAGPYPEPEFTPHIPSISISFRDARHLLEALRGHGMCRSHLPSGWQGGLPGIGYFSGPSQMLVDLINDTEYIDTKLYNVIGTIKGALSECVVLGNHHDPWSAGCVDPDTGSSAMNEVVNWKGSRSRLGTSQNHVRTQLCISIDVYPLTVRSILASWDGEEYGLLGTTAWATQNSDHLKRNCIACK
jgi:N-acetylated-alpha-linked acidic dipeptidase